MTVASAARQWQAAGFSTIPILPNATKRPAVKWLEFQTRIPALSELQGWWENGRQHGLALVMGTVSGNAEMLELEADAYTPEIMVALSDAMHEAGVGDVWDRLTGQTSYTEESPSGGLHIIYRVTGHPVPGNEKIAATAESKVLAETRGEGGYVIVAPSPGLCHPSGAPWKINQGEAGACLEITWEQRCGVHQVIRSVLDHDPRPNNLPVPVPYVPTSDVLTHVARGEAELRPGDEIERLDWDHPLLLGGAGWQVEHQAGGTTYWTRPGKDPRDGASATTGRAGDRDRLWVFSTSTAFPPNVALTKFAAYAWLHHGGNMSLAAGQLRREGFGSERRIDFVPSFQFEESIEGESSKVTMMDDMGAREMLADFVNGDYRWVVEEKEYYRWNGRTWSPDRDRQLTREWDKLTRQLALSDPDQGVRKWASKHRGGGHTRYAVKEMRSVEGISVPRSVFDHDRGRLCVQNGVLDLRTGQLSPHCREDLITRISPATYDPAAECPVFETFMAQVLPDAEVRAYVQRAVGYTMLGDVDQRALFLVWGPSGTGKTQFMEAMQHVFGDYGVTASLGAFMGGKERGPTNEVHRLRGKRFVSTSETADDTRFNEEVVKRLTGADTMTTRALYQEEQEWRPECVIWVATNHKPKFNSDDDAIWRRSKLVPFLTRFGTVTGLPEVAAMAQRFLFPETDGILNWILAGVQDLLDGGLKEPEQIRLEAVAHRQEVDQVATFLEESLQDGVLVRDEAGHILSGDLFQIYQAWSIRSGERPFGRRRFSNRVKANWPETEYRNVGNGRVTVTGISRGAQLSLGGSFMLTANTNDWSGPSS